MPDSGLPQHEGTTMYLTMLDDRFVVMRGESIIDCHKDANVLTKRWGAMPYVS